MIFGVGVICNLCGCVGHDEPVVFTQGVEDAQARAQQRAQADGWVLFAVSREFVAPLGEQRTMRHHLCPPCADVASPEVRERIVSGHSDVEML